MHSCMQVCSFLTPSNSPPFSCAFVLVQCAVKYSKERKAFGSPISKLYAIQLKISQMASALGPCCCFSPCTLTFFALPSPSRSLLTVV